MKKTIIFSFIFITTGLQCASQGTRKSNGDVLRLYPIDPTEQSTTSNLEFSFVTPNARSSVRSPGISSMGYSPDQTLQGSYSFPIPTPTICQEALSLREQWDQEDAFMALVALITLPEEETLERTRIEESEQRVSKRLPKNFNEYLKRTLLSKKTYLPDCNNDFPFNYATQANKNALFPDIQK